MSKKLPATAFCWYERDLPGAGFSDTSPSVSHLSMQMNQLTSLADLSGMTQLRCVPSPPSPLPCPFFPSSTPRLRSLQVQYKYDNATGGCRLLLSSARVAIQLEGMPWQSTTSQLAKLKMVSAVLSAEPR